MSHSDVEPVTIRVDDAHNVSGLLLEPAQARACYVLAHGAGAGMAHPFMERVAAELGERGIATLRYQFPYMEQGGKRPDPPKLAQATVRAAVAAAGRLRPALALFAGGKSFGGRMTSQAQGASPLPGVHGLVFLGFPLHPAGRPSDRARRASLRRAGPDAVPARHARRARRARAAGAGDGAARRARVVAAPRRTPTIPSTCRRAADARMPTSGARCSMRLPLGRCR